MRTTMVIMKKRKARNEVSFRRRRRLRGEESHDRDSYVPHHDLTHKSNRSGSRQQQQAAVVAATAAAAATTVRAPR